MAFPLRQFPQGDRICGPCTACCTVMAVQELGKGNYERCRHLTSSGCGIYPDRPGTCRDWSCLWRLGLIEGDERRRPDNLGLLFTPLRHGGTAVLTAYEIWKDASKEPPAKYLLGQLQRKLPVVVVNPSNQFWVACDSEDKAQEITELIVAENLLRRGEGDAGVTSQRLP